MTFIGQEVSVEGRRGVVVGMSPGHARVSWRDAAPDSGTTSVPVSLLEQRGYVRYLQQLRPDTGDNVDAYVKGGWRAAKILDSSADIALYTVAAAVGVAGQTERVQVMWCRLAPYGEWTARPSEI